MNGKLEPNKPPPNKSVEVMTRLENRGHYNARYDSVKASFFHFFKQRPYKRSVF